MACTPASFQLPVTALRLTRSELQQGWSAGQPLRLQLQNPQKMTEFESRGQPPQISTGSMSGPTAQSAVPLKIRVVEAPGGA